MKRKWIPGMLDIGQNTRNPRLFRLGLDMLRKLFAFGRLPLIRSIHPWMQPENTNMYWIPINKNLEKDDSIPLPYKVVETFIEKASTHVVMDFCGCRVGYECTHFPTEIGCLMMGEDANLITPKMSRKVSKEEAKAHLHKAMEAGLPPFIGKARIDNFIFGVPDNSRLLTVCFCCPCCCITDLLRQVESKERKQIIKRIEGLEIFINQEACVGCGKCAEQCYIDAITVSEDGSASISQDDCLGCGRCAPSCAKQAIHVKLDNPDFVEEAVRSIQEYVSV